MSKYLLANLFASILSAKLVLSKLAFCIAIKSLFSVFAAFAILSLSALGNPFINANSAGGLFVIN